MNGRPWDEAPVSNHKGGLLKVTAEATTKIVELEATHLPARVWEATTESGLKCYLFVTRVMVAEGADTSQFERELKEQKPPCAELQAFPLALFLS